MLFTYLFLPGAGLAFIGLSGSGNAPAHQPVLELPVLLHAAHTRTRQSGEETFRWVIFFWKKIDKELHFFQLNIS